MIVFANANIRSTQWPWQGRHLGYAADELHNVGALRIRVLEREHLQHRHAERVDVHALAVPCALALLARRIHLGRHELGSA